MLAYLNQSWLGSILTIVTFIFAVLLSIYLFFKSRSVKKVAIFIENESILDKRNSNRSELLEILFDGEKIERLNKAIIYFWNSGTQTIYRNDLNNIDPPRIYLGDTGKILQVNFLSNSRNVINPSIKKDMNSYYLEFDFLDASDGVVLEVLHTGENNDIKIEGTIIGIKERLNVENQKSKLLKLIIKIISFISFPYLDKTFGIISIILGGIAGFIGLLILFGIDPLSIGIKANNGFVLIFVGVFYSVLGAAIYILLKEPYPNKLDSYKK